MSDWIYSEEDLQDEIKTEKERIRSELTQAIENGIIKVEKGSEKLFELLS